MRPKVFRLRGPDTRCLLGSYAVTPVRHTTQRRLLTTLGAGVGVATAAGVTAAVLATPVIRADSCARRIAGGLRSPSRSNRPRASCRRRRILGPIPRSRNGLRGAAEPGRSRSEFRRRRHGHDAIVRAACRQSHTEADHRGLDRRVLPRRHNRLRDSQRDWSDTNPGTASSSTNIRKSRAAASRGFGWW